MKPKWCYKIGKRYVGGDGILYENTDEVSSSYRVMKRVNNFLFDQIPIPVIFQDTDPYDDYYEMKTRVEREGLLRVYKKGDPPDNLSKEDNLKARAVHDYYGHLKYDVDFSPEGEFLKWYNSSNHYPPAVTQVLFAEVVCQTGAIHYTGGFDYIQRDAIPPSNWIEQVCEYYNKPIPEGAYYWD